MFNIAKVVTEYSWPVEVRVAKDGGGFERFSFDARFRRISQDRVQEIRDAIVAGTIKDRDIVDEVLVDWSGVNDGDQALEFSEANKASVLQIAGVGAAVVMAFLESIAGARRKN